LKKFENRGIKHVTRDPHAARQFCLFNPHAVPVTTTESGLPQGTRTLSFKMFFVRVFKTQKYLLSLNGKIQLSPGNQ
jgi:hypothetical protein